MPQIGPMEILVVAALALIVFGPDKLPEIARTIGRAMSELRRMASEVKEEFDLGLDDDDDRPAAATRRPHPNEVHGKRAESALSAAAAREAATQEAKEGSPEDSSGDDEGASDHDTAVSTGDDNEAAPTPALEDDRTGEAAPKPGAAIDAPADEKARGDSGSEPDDSGDTASEPADAASEPADAGDFASEERRVRSDADETEPQPARPDDGERVGASEPRTVDDRDRPMGAAG